MSVNKYRPHVFVLPEDEANSRIANGFLLEEALDLQAIQVLPKAGGWTEVRNEFQNTHRIEMRKYSLRHMVLLVDFDERSDRFEQIRKTIPDELADRVFVLGV